MCSNVAIPDAITSFVINLTSAVINPPNIGQIFNSYCILKTTPKTSAKRDIKALKTKTAF